MIKNIVFDMGQVLIRFERSLFIQRLGVDKDDEELLLREVFRSIEWAQLDRGILTEKDATKIICERVPERLHGAVYNLINKWDSPIIPVEGMEELLLELKGEGHDLYLLSNASSRQHDYWPRIPGNSLFTDTLISADVGLIKPQPELYRMACEKFRIHPEESIFIDDSAANVEAACNLGWNGIVFHGDVGELRLKLQAMIGKV